MKEIPPFSFERTMGIVWVCDIKNSSGFLNSDDLIDDIENFLPRFYYVSKLIVETYGGIFLKWTGDGFLALFRFESGRNIQQASGEVFDAAWHLSFISNVTQMGLKPKKKIAIRHGITLENDALLMKIQSGKEENLDIIGRSVVLAFRLSGISSSFPSIVTQKELVRPGNKKFIPWRPTKEERLRFFKGEKFGTDMIWISRNKKGAVKDWNTEPAKVEKLLTESILKLRSAEREEKILAVMNKMDNGPEWCREISLFERGSVEKSLIRPLNELRKGSKKGKN